MTISSQTQFGGSQQADTLSDGTAVFERVFAGNYNVSATDPNTRLSGSASGTAAAGSSATTNVQLQPAGTVFGVVLATDGLTLGGAGSASTKKLLILRSAEKRARRRPYRFEPCRSALRVDVPRRQHRVRAKETGAPFQQRRDSHAQPRARRTGTVSGRVTHPNATGAPSLTVR